MSLLHNSSAEGEINTKVYSPERFGFTQQEVFRAHGKLLRDQSDGVFLYQWDDKNDIARLQSGGNYFGKIANSKEYGEQVTGVEDSILGGNTSLGKIVKERKTHVELGPGILFANKIRRIIYEQYLKQTGKKYVHVGRDIASSITDQCAKEYNETDTPNLTFASVNTDRRMKEIIEDLTNKMYYRLGGSIGNYDEADVIAILKNLSSDSQLKGRDIVISHFLKPKQPNKKEKIEKIKSQYNIPEVEQFILKGFESIGIPADHLEFVVEYEESWEGVDRIKLGARVIKPITLHTGSQSVVKQPGELLRAISSRRYTTEQFAELANKADCKLTQTYTDENETMGVSVLRSKPKRVPLYAKATAAVAGALLLTLGGIQVGSHLEKSKRDDKQKELTEETFFSQKSQWADENYRLGSSKEEARKFIAILEARYDASLTSDQEQLITVMYFDWLKTRPEYLIDNTALYGGMMEYLPDFYDAREIDRFLWEHKNTLNALGISILANPELVKYEEALENSYFYAGDALSFDEVDVKLPDYHSGTVSIVTASTDKKDEGKIDHYTYSCGIKYIDEKPYMVFKNFKDGQYRLEEIPHELQKSGLGTGEFVVDLIQKGEVPILAERIKTFILGRYTQGTPTYFMNGQSDIAKYLTDMYAKGYDLSYLLAGGDEEYMYSYTNGSILEVFVAGILLPAIKDQLSEGSERMHDVDWKETQRDIEKYAPTQGTIDTLYGYLETYTGGIVSPRLSTKAKSEIMKYVLSDHAWRYIDSDQDARCRLTDHRDAFAKIGIDVPVFPDRIEEYLSNPKKYSPTDSIVDELWSPPSSGYSSRIVFVGFEDYRLLNGDVIFVAHRAGGLLGKGNLVGRRYSEKIGEQLWNDYRAGKYGKVYNSDNMRGTQYQLQQKSQIVDALFMRKVPFNSQAVHEMMADYRQRKEAYELYRQKKSGSN